MQEQDDVIIAKLYPNLTADELAEAEADLEQYLALVVRVYSRLQSDRGVSTILTEVKSRGIL